MKNRSRILLVIALLLMRSSGAFAQVNYVLNGDFETHSGCPQQNENIRLATYWSPIDSNATQPFCVADYCHVCGSTLYNLNTIPWSATYWQYPHSGHAMAQVLFYYNEYNPSYENKRDYLQGRLFKKLTSGKQYCVSFYVNLEESSYYAIKDLGAYLDDGSIDTVKNCGEPQTQFTPQIVSATIISDTMNWVLVQGSFVAKGNERFITIGNFKDKTGTTLSTMPLNSLNAGIRYFSGYLVDDVSVVESDLKADAGPDRHIGLGDSVYIGRPISSAVWCDWNVLGNNTIIGKGPGLWVKPTTTTSYVVTQTLCGLTKKDTVRVEVWKLGVTSINGKTQHYSLSPNPAGSAIQLQQEVEDLRPVGIRVCDAVGRVVYSSTRVINDGRIEINLAGLSAGVYYMQVRDGYWTVYNLKFVKQ